MYIAYLAVSVALTCVHQLGSNTRASPEQAALFNATFQISCIAFTKHYTTSLCAGHRFQTTSDDCLAQAGAALAMLDAGAALKCCTSRQRMLWSYKPDLPHVQPNSSIVV